MFFSIKVSIDQSFQKVLLVTFHLNNQTLFLRKYKFEILLIANIQNNYLLEDN